MSCRFDWFISPLTAKYSVFYEPNLVLQFGLKDHQQKRNFIFIRKRYEM